jgi:hypothetical protein
VVHRLSEVVTAPWSTRVQDRVLLRLSSPDKWLPGPLAFDLIFQLSESAGLIFGVTSKM